MFSLKIQYICFYLNQIVDLFGKIHMESIFLEILRYIEAEDIIISFTEIVLLWL